MVDVRTKPEWLYIGVPNLELLQKKTVCVEWQIYPDMKNRANELRKSILPHCLSPEVENIKSELYIISINMNNVI